MSKTQQRPGQQIKRKTGKGPLPKTVTWILLGVAFLLDLAQLFFTFFGFVVAAGIGGATFQIVKDLVPIPGLDVVFATIAGAIAGVASGFVAVPALTPVGIVIASIITIAGTLMFWFWFLLLGVRMGDINNVKKYINMALAPIFDVIPLLGAILPTLTIMVGLTILFENLERKQAREQDIVQ